MISLRRGACGEGRRGQFDRVGRALPRKAPVLPYWSSRLRRCPLKAETSGSSPLYGTMRRTPSASRYTIQRGRERMLSCRCCWVIEARPELRDWVAIREGLVDWILEQERWSYEFWPTKAWDNLSHAIMEENDRKAREVELPSLF